MCLTALTLVAFGSSVGHFDWGQGLVELMVMGLAGIVIVQDNLVLVVWYLVEESCQQFSLAELFALSVAANSASCLANFFRFFQDRFRPCGSIHCLLLHPIALSLVSVIVI